MLKALLKHLTLEPRAPVEPLQTVSEILNSGAGVFSALAEEATTLSNVLQILLAPLPVAERDESEMTETDFAMTDQLRRQRQLTRAKGHFRLFRKRLMSAVSRQEGSNVEVALAADWIRSLLRQMYDKRQQSLLVTRNTVDLLRQLQVYCDAVALSTADALLDCPESADVLQAVALAVATVNEGKAVDPADANDLAGHLPFVVRGSWSDRAAGAGTLLSIEVAKEERRMGGLRLVPPEIAKEAVYLQYSADTGLASMLPQLINEWALNPFPRNVYMATSRSMQRRMVQFDSFHQSDSQLLVDVQKLTAPLVLWKDCKMYEPIDGEDFDGGTDEDALQLYTAEFEGVYLLGSQLALSCAPMIATSAIFELGESADKLMINGNSFQGQYSWENCTGLCGPAIIAGTVIGSLNQDMGGCLAGGRLYFAQDACFAGPSRDEAQAYFVDDVVDHVFELLDPGSPVLLTGVGSGREADEVLPLRQLRVDEDGEPSDEIEAFEFALGKLLSEAVLESGAVRMVGYVLHGGAYLPFTKHVQFHFGEPNFLTFATHEWPLHMHLHERVYISDPYSDTHQYVAKLFARCHGAHRLRLNEMGDRNWLVNRIRNEASNPQETPQLFLSIALLNSMAMSRFVAPVVRDANYESEEEAEQEIEPGVQYFPNGVPSGAKPKEQEQAQAAPVSQSLAPQPSTQPQRMHFEPDSPVSVTFQPGPMGVKWNVLEGDQPMVLAFVGEGSAAANGGLTEGMELKELNGESVPEMRSKQGLDEKAIMEKMGPRPLTLTLQAPAPAPAPAPATEADTAQVQQLTDMRSGTVMYDSLRGGFPAPDQLEDGAAPNTPREPEPSPEQEQEQEHTPEPELEPEEVPLEELPCLAECCRFFRSPTPLLRCIRTNMRACCQLLREASEDRNLSANLQHEPLLRQFGASAEFLRHFLRPDVGRAVHFVGVRPRAIRLLDEMEAWAESRAQAGADAETTADDLADPVAELEELETLLALMEMGAAQDMRTCCSAASVQLKRALGDRWVA